MKNRRFIAPALLLALAVLGSTGAHAAAPVTVGTDDAGDWGADVDTTMGPIGDAIGQDLISAKIQDAGGGTVNFIIGLTSLPATGGIGESPRYLWEMTVNDLPIEIDGKFTNYSRGACDPTAKKCPPPRDPGSAPFLIRGDCDTSGNVAVCKEVGLVHATFDTASATITIPVPFSMLGVTSGCASIAPAVNTASFPGGSVIAIPSAFFSQNSMPNDKMTLDDAPVLIC